MKNKSTVNHNEVRKFYNISKEWWKPKGKFKVLHKFNNARVDYILQKFEQYNIKTNASIVDVGCGGGILSEAMYKKGYTNILGVDVEENAIKEAKNHASKEKLSIKYNVASVEDLVAKGEKFDVVFAMEIIEHVADVDYFLSNLKQLLNVDGIIFFSTINKTVESLFLAKFMAEYVLNWLPKGTHNFSKFISPLTLQGKLKDHNIDNIEYSMD